MVFYRIAAPFVAVVEKSSSFITRLAGQSRAIAAAGIQRKSSS